MGIDKSPKLVSDAIQKLIEDVQARRVIIPPPVLPFMEPDPDFNCRCTIDYGGPDYSETIEVEFMEKENRPESEKEFRIKGLTEHMRENHSEDELKKMGLEFGGPLDKTDDRAIDPEIQIMSDDERTVNEFQRDMQMPVFSLFNEKESGDNKPTLGQQTITGRITGGQKSNDIEDHLERPVTLQDMRKAMSIPLAHGSEADIRETVEALERNRAEREIERPRPVPNATLHMDGMETKLILSMETIREQLGPNVQIIARSDLIKTGQDIIKNQPDDLNVFLNELADRIFGKENQNGNQY